MFFWKQKLVDKTRTDLLVKGSIAANYCPSHLGLPDELSWWEISKPTPLEPELGNKPAGQQRQSTLRPQLSQAWWWQECHYACFHRFSQALWCARTFRASASEQVRHFNYQGQDQLRNLRTSCGFEPDLLQTVPPSFIWRLRWQMCALVCQRDTKNVKHVLKSSKSAWTGLMIYSKQKFRASIRLSNSQPAGMKRNVWLMFSLAVCSSKMTFIDFSAPIFALILSQCPIF